MQPSPCLCPVRPRAVRRGSTSVLLLEDAVGDLLASGARHDVSLSGPGAVEALAHLAAVFAHEPGIWFATGLAAAPPPARVVVHGSGREEDLPLHFELQPWGDDEVLEYLMTRHRSAVGPALAAWRSAPPHDLGHFPNLCAEVLDEVARNGIAVYPALATRMRCRTAGAEDRPHRLQRSSALRRLRSGGSATASAVWRAAELLHLALDDGLGAPSVALHVHPWRPHLRTAIAELLRHDPAMVAAFVDVLERGDARLPFVLSALCLHRPGFRPPSAPAQPLLHACLPEVDLSYRVLRESIYHSELDGADLTAVHGDGCALTGTSLRGACAADSRWTDLLAMGLRAENLYAPNSAWRQAELVRASFRGADLTQADLRQADLSAASLAGASLAAADLSRARCRGTDLSGASLQGARLVGTRCADLDLRHTDLTSAVCFLARFVRCDFAGTVLPQFAARCAHFLDCDLSGVRWRDADLVRTSFQNSRLADADCEGADLREADLRGVQFHAGNARSGLVDSTIASEGSRTGFYTDESLEDRFQAPEAVRKANLSRCDLRGARLHGTDFYLVDLRGARLDAEQLPWLRRCRAILDRDLTADTEGRSAESA